MTAGARSKLFGPGTLLAVAVIGPFLAASPDPPTVALSAAQLLPPGFVAQEVPVAGGGYARAPAIVVSETGLRVRSDRGWRDLPGVRPTGPVVTRRLWLGTDHQGRSLLARTLHGARTSLLVGAVATLMAVVLGTALGVVSALGTPRLTTMLGIGTDGLLALPRLLLLLLLGVLLRGSTIGVAAAIGLASWMEISRLVEAEVRRLDALPFVAAVRGSGAGKFRLALRHVLPNLLPVLAVAAPLVATEAILLESTLSFLGIAGGAGTTSWGQIVADGQRLMPSGWWIAVFPGVLLCVTALVVHGLARAEADRPRSLGSP